MTIKAGNLIDTIEYDYPTFHLSRYYFGVKSLMDSVKTSGSRRCKVACKTYGVIDIESFFAKLDY